MSEVVRADSFFFMRQEPVELKRYLPRFLNKDALFSAIQDALTAEHERYRLWLVEVARQFFVETATWALPDWERLLKITPAKGASEELRRAVVRVKRRGDTVMTLENTRRLLEDFAPRGDVDVRELGGNLLELVIRNGTFYWDELMAALWEQLPAHLTFNFEINRTLSHTHHIGHIILEQGTATRDLNDTATTGHALRFVQGTNARGTTTTQIGGTTPLKNTTTTKTGAVELIHGRVRIGADIEAAGDFTAEDFERYLRRRWLQFKDNPVVKYYRHRGHVFDDGELEPDDPEYFPLDADFLRIYWGFKDTRAFRYQTLMNPREDIEGREIRALGEIGAAGRVFVRNGAPTTGIYRALYIHKTETKII